MQARVWLLAPAATLYCGDVTFTLVGQPHGYWQGDYQLAQEANPLAHVLLARSPWLFLGVATAWLMLLSAVILFWRHPLATWTAVLLAIGHAIGAASWFTPYGVWGYAMAVVYLVAAAQATGWCWKRFDRQ